MLASILLPLLFASIALCAPAAPSFPSFPKPPTGSPLKLAGCSVSNAKVDIPTNQSTIVQPTLPVSFVSLGVGTQNYTCTNGTYTNVGAFAELFDISCLYGTPFFNTVQDLAIAGWSRAPASLSAVDMLKAIPFTNIVTQGEHYFIQNSAGGLSPKWDMTSHAFKGNSDAFIVAKKVAQLAAPNAADIAWVSLTKDTGSLADQVFRTDTRLGQPPSSCAPGSPPLQVRYTSKYWLLGGSIKK